MQLKFKTTNLLGIIRELETRASHAGSYEMQEELSSIRSTYTNMLHYMVKGVDDPNSNKIYDDLLVRCHTLGHRMNRLLRLQEKIHDKYVMVQTSLSSGSNFIRNLLHKLSETCQRISLLTAFPHDRESIQEHELSSLSNSREQILLTLFEIIWTSDVWHGSEYTMMHESLHSSDLGTNEKSFLISAVTMGLLEMFDEQKLMTLFDAYESDDTQVKIRSLIGIVLSIRIYDRELQFYKKASTRLSLLLDSDKFIKDVYLVLMQLQYSKLTDKVTDKMRNDIIPGLLSSGKFKRTQFGIQEVEDYLTQHGENPEWHHLEDEQAYSKIQEMTDLQMDGADVYMGSFSQMKGNSFFQHPGNWLMPFSKSTPCIRSLISKLGNSSTTILTTLLEHAPFCDSDKYSFAFMLENIGSQGRELLNQSFKGEIADEDLSDHIKDLQDGSNKPSDISRRYIQDLYRFFTLYPFHYQFDNPFSSNEPSFTPMCTQCFRPLLSSREQLLSLSDFLMHKEVYDDAILLYESLSPEEKESNASLWQKIGFCYQKKGDNTKAIECYTTAFSLEPDSRWTLKHLAKVSYQSAHYEEAEAYYDMLLDDEQDNLVYLKRKADCMLRSEHYAEAIPLLYKIHYLDEQSSEVRSSLAHCLLMTGDRQKAKEMYESLISEFPSQVEMIMGLANIYYVEGDLESSFTYYSEVYVLIRNEVDGDCKFKRMFVDAAKQLKTLGVEVQKFQMMYDAVLAITP